MQMPMLQYKLRPKLLLKPLLRQSQWAWLSLRLLQVPRLLLRLKLKLLYQHKLMLKPQLRLNIRVMLLMRFLKIVCSKRRKWIMAQRAKSIRLSTQELISRTLVWEMIRKRRAKLKKLLRLTWDPHPILRYKSLRITRLLLGIFQPMLEARS